jgi:hypothetical protein
MDFNFTEEQSMLRDTVASFLQDKYDFETRRKIVAPRAAGAPTTGRPSPRSWASWARRSAKSWAAWAAARSTT